MNKRLHVLSNAGSLPKSGQMETSQVVAIISKLRDHSGQYFVCVHHEFVGPVEDWQCFSVNLVAGDKQTWRKALLLLDVLFELFVARAVAFKWLEMHVMRRIDWR